MNYEEIIEKSLNKSFEEIQEIAILLRESMRQYFSRMLIDNDEENPMLCDIIINSPENFGLNDAQIPHLTGLFSLLNEGIIYIQIDNDEYIEFDEFSLDTLYWIIKSIEEQ